MDLQSQISDIKPIQNSKQPLIITLIYSFTSCHDRSLFTNIQLLFPSTSKASLGKHVYCTFKVIRKFWHGYYLCKKIWQGSSRCYLSSKIQPLIWIIYLC